MRSIRRFTAADFFSTIRIVKLTRACATEEK